MQQPTKEQELPMVQMMQKLFPHGLNFCDPWKSRGNDNNDDDDNDNSFVGKETEVTNVDDLSMSTTPSSSDKVAAAAAVAFYTTTAAVVVPRSVSFEPIPVPEEASVETSTTAAGKAKSSSSRSKAMLLCAAVAVVLVGSVLAVSPVASNGMVTISVVLPLVVTISKPSRRKLFAKRS